MRGISLKWLVQDARYDILQSEQLEMTTMVVRDVKHALASARFEEEIRKNSVFSAATRCRHPEQYLLDGLKSSVIYRRYFTFVLQRYSYILNLAMAYMTSKPLRKFRNQNGKCLLQHFVSAKREFSESDCRQKRKGTKCFSIRKASKASFHSV